MFQLTFLKEILLVFHDILAGFNFNDFSLQLFLLFICSGRAFSFSCASPFTPLLPPPLLAPSIPCYIREPVSVLLRAFVCVCVCV